MAETFIADSPASERVAPEPPSAQMTCPLFPVATHKFIVLSVCSLGIYELYWCYQNWKRLKQASGERLSPFWRAVFAPLWVTRPSFCTTASERVYITATDCEIKMDGTKGLQAAGAGGL